MQIILAESPDADIFRRAIEFFSNTLLTPKEKRGLKVRVKFCDRIKGGETLRIKNKTFDITVSTKEKIDGALFILAHETIHTSQFLKKDLTFVSGLVHWKGKDVSQMSYLNQPHEIEATEKALFLTRQFIFGR